MLFKITPFKNISFCLIVIRQWVLSLGWDKPVLKLNRKFVHFE